MAFLEKLTVPHLVKKYSAFMKSEKLFSRLQEHISGSYFYPVESIPTLYSICTKTVLLLPCRPQGWRKYSSYSFFISTLDVLLSASLPGALYPRERTFVTRWTGGSVGLGAGLDTEDRGKTLCFCSSSKTGRPVCSQTLY
jgi:hypothetical protein